MELTCVELIELNYKKKLSFKFNIRLYLMVSKRFLVKYLMKKGNIVIIVGCFLMYFLTINFIVLVSAEIQGGIHQLNIVLAFLFVFLLIITVEIALVIYGHIKEQLKSIEVYAIIIPFFLPILSVVFIAVLSDSIPYGYPDYYDQFVAYPYLLLILTVIVFFGSLKNILDRYYSAFE